MATMARQKVLINVFSIFNKNRLAEHENDYKVDDWEIICSLPAGRAGTILSIFVTTLVIHFNKEHFALYFTRKRVCLHYILHV